MNNRIVLGSLAMDLKRAALGYHRGSVAMAERFFTEALKRKKECDMKIIDPYLFQILNNIESLKGRSNKDKAENALMYSTLIQNYVLRRL